MKSSFTRTAVAVAALLAGRTVSAQDFHANDLTPAGTSAGKLTGASRGRQVGGAQSGGGYSHAVLLAGNALSATDLHPSGYYYSMATCTDDLQQGGWAYATSGSVHAIVWSGSAASFVDLNPSGFNISYCLGVHGGEQVGYAQSQSYFVTASHAMLWHGSAGSAIDLHPGTALFSRALGVCDGEQVGYVSDVAYAEGDVIGYHTTSRAHRWTGYAASAVSLHPAGYDASEATCSNGVQQGGWGYLAVGTSHQHALLWSGDAASVIDLHPAGYVDSRINALTATQQIGEGWVGTPGAAGSVRHALLWTGSANSVVDLNQYLPAGYTQAVATGIDADGNVVGFAYNSSNASLTIPTDAIAVVFAPGAAPASGLATLSLSSSNVAPTTIVQGVATLSAPAPTGGVTLSFLSTATSLVATPAPVTIAEGATAATFTLNVGGSNLIAPTALKLYATDGTVSRAANLTVTPIVNLASVTGNPVEGGFSTTGTLTLNIPAQAGGAVVSLTSGDPALLTVPATVTIPLGNTGASFVATTAPVATLTNVPLTATFNGQSVTTTVAVNPAPVVAVATLSFPSVVGGQPVTGTVTLNNFVRAAGGAVIALTSSDAGTVQVPATVTIPYGGTTATFQATTAVVSALKGVAVTASYNGSSAQASVMVNPIPTVTITTAEYLTDTQMLKVTASTSYENSILTYGVDNGPAIGTMQLELGVFKGSMVMATTPSSVTVWNSWGGQATLPVTLRTSGGSGGGGSSSSSSTTTTTASYKLVVKTIGKGTVTSSPVGTSFPVGTVVTLTATPDGGSRWYGWTGDANSANRTISVTITKDMTVSANFK